MEQEVLRESGGVAHEDGRCSQQVLIVMKVAFCKCLVLMLIHVPSWRRFRDDGDDRSMEVGWAALQAEEKRSARLGECLGQLMGTECS